MGQKNLGVEIVPGHRKANSMSHESVWIVLCFLLEVGQRRMSDAAYDKQSLSSTEVEKQIVTVTFQGALMLSYWAKFT